MKRNPLVTIAACCNDAILSHRLLVLHSILDSTFYASFMLRHISRKNSDIFN